MNKIANYFNVSVEYLIEKEETTIIQGHKIEGSYNVVESENVQILTTRDLTPQEIEMLRAFHQLSEMGKARTMVFTENLLNEERNEKKV